LLRNKTYIPPLSCQQPVNCRWGPYGDWSECDGCSRTKVRTRHVDVYAQFGGVACSGEATQTQPCVTQKRCPLETGCGDRFRCTSGMLRHILYYKNYFFLNSCISQSLVCNGDQDCEDGLDERGCGLDSSQYSCDIDKTPPNSDFAGRGYDVLTGKLKAGVINTLSFGGQCRKVFSGDHKVYYRLPQNILRYNFEVKVDNDESDESYESSWSYMQHIQSNALVGHDRRTFHKELIDNKAYRLIILKNKVELAQFQNSAPQYLTLAEGFWKALSSLPHTYDYSAYRQLFRTYGTHYLSEGSLGGEYQALLELDRQALSSTSTTDIEYQRCWRKVKRRLFRKKVKITCEKLTKSLSSSHGNNVNKMPIKVNVIGGDPALTGPLTVLNLENPEANGEVYDNWASSVKDFPEVINQKLRPLYELVKEVQCAGLKKLHLKRATEEYLAEEHPCHCRPCQNNGQPLLTGSECRCVCRPGTTGQACERGAVIGEQPGVIHGSWSCWSSWGSCSEGQRSRIRSCNNPAPSRGGHHCSGPEVEQKPCEDADMEYLNGNAMAECTENQVWRTGAMVCKSTSPLHYSARVVMYWFHCLFIDRISDFLLCLTQNPFLLVPGSTCGVPSLNSDVIATPTKATYEIGDRVSLSCPAGSVLESELSDIMCSSSLQWSPSPASAHCKAAPAPPPGLKCKLWETVGKTDCVCKMPFQCLTSLQLCARLGSSRTRLLGVCQLGALKCMGRSFTLASDSDCNWPDQTSTSCEDCKPGTICQGDRCVCQNVSECPKDSAPLCVSSGAGSVAKTMTECEVGARRCAGEQLNVISIEACPE
uniref:Complement component C7 n=1 Tax=Dicentrarchus labrax TaxID=13489 RepID=A0A8C4NZI6_DICLA